MQPPDASLLDLEPRQLAELRNLLARHVPGATVWAYGSRVVGGAHCGSDLDLVLRNVQGPESPVVGRSDLIDALQASMLPMRLEAHDWSQCAD